MIPVSLHTKQQLLSAARIAADVQVFGEEPIAVDRSMVRALARDPELALRISRFDAASIPDADALEALTVWRGLERSLRPRPYLFGAPERLDEILGRRARGAQDLEPIRGRFEEAKARLSGGDAGAPALVDLYRPLYEIANGQRRKAEMLYGYLKRQLDPNGSTSDPTDALFRKALLSITSDERSQYFADALAVLSHPAIRHEAHADKLANLVARDLQGTQLPRQLAILGEVVATKASSEISVELHVAAQGVLRELARRPSKDAIPVLEQVLRLEAEPALSFLAIKALAATERPEAFWALARRVEASLGLPWSENTSAYAAEACGHPSAAQVVPVLARALDDERPSMRYLAAGALAAIGSEDAMQALSKHLEAYLAGAISPDLAAFDLMAVREAGGYDANLLTPVLRRVLLESGDPENARRAATALASIDNAGARLTLEQASSSLASDELRYVGEHCRKLLEKTEPKTVSQRELRRLGAHLDRIDSAIRFASPKGEEARLMERERATLLREALGFGFIEENLRLAKPSDGPSPTTYSQYELEAAPTGRTFTVHEVPTYELGLALGLFEQWAVGAVAADGPVVIRHDDGVATLFLREAPHDEVRSWHEHPFAHVLSGPEPIADQIRSILGRIEAGSLKHLRDGLEGRIDHPDGWTPGFDGFVDSFRRTFRFERLSPEQRELVLEFARTTPRGAERRGPLETDLLRLAQSFREGTVLDGALHTPVSIRARWQESRGMDSIYSATTPDGRYFGEGPSELEAFGHLVSNYPQAFGIRVCGFQHDGQQVFDSAGAGSTDFVDHRIDVTVSADGLRFRASCGEVESAGSSLNEAVGRLLEAHPDRFLLALSTGDR